jgi:hypothetical protein
MDLSIIKFVDHIYHHINIENWNNFELNFGEAYPKHNKIISDKINEGKPTRGIYAIKESNRFIYVGIGCNIIDRLKSHYKDVHNENKAYPRWSAFFQNYGKSVKIYWKEIDLVEDNKKNAKMLEVIERILQEKLDTEFENFFKFYDASVAFKEYDIEKAIEKIIS